MWSVITVLKLAVSVTLCCVLTSGQELPISISTWPSTWPAAEETFNQMNNLGNGVVESVVEGVSLCDRDTMCGGASGAGGSPSETGEVTLDAMIMDGTSMDVGSVGSLRRIPAAIAVAHAVMKYTKHTMLVANLARDFAVQMGFQEMSMETNGSRNSWNNWKASNCQPNYYTNVVPDPNTNCGPFTPAAVTNTETQTIKQRAASIENEPEPFDTIGMVAVNASGYTSAGCSTNGKQWRVTGRMGDSPVPGSGAYAEDGKGSAAGSGDGDLMMRFQPSFHAVQLMGRGYSPQQAAYEAVNRIMTFFPGSQAAIVAVNTTGGYGGACSQFSSLTVNIASPLTVGVGHRTESFPCDW